MSIKLIAVDLDDTLLNEQQGISPRTQQVIRRAVAQGVNVTVATGRMYRSALPYATQLNLDVPIITYNGGLIKCSLSGETLFHREIEPEIAKQILALFQEQGWYIQAYVDDVLYVKERNDKARYYEKIAGVKAEVVGDRLYSLFNGAIKLLAMAEPSEIEQINRIIQSRFAGKIYTAVSKPNYLEMTHPTVNKGKALEFLAARLEINREEIMAVGDSNNDLDMIMYAGFGVAMGNASDKIKAAAQAVTFANNEDGVAEAIEKYVLCLPAKTS